MNGSLILVFVLMIVGKTIGTSEEMPPWEGLHEKVYTLHEMVGPLPGEMAQVKEDVSQIKSMLMQFLKITESDLNPGKVFTIKTGFEWRDNKGTYSSMKELREATITTKEDSIESCRQECIQAEGCVGFTFTWFTNTCYLKTNLQAVTLYYTGSQDQAAGTLTLREGAGWHNKQGFTNTLSSVKAEKATKCEIPCRDTEGCAGWTYVKAAKRCDLKAHSEVDSYHFGGSGVVAGLI